MGVIDEVKQKTDIVEIVEQYTPPLKKSGKAMRGLCPFHSEKTPSFFVYPEQQSWHCFGACNAGGDVFSFVMKKENMEFGDALRHLASRAGVVIPEYAGPAEKKEEKEALYAVLEAAALFYHNLLLNSPEAGKARSYLAGRDISGKSTADFGLGYSPTGWEGLREYLAGRGFDDADMLTAGLIMESESGKRHDRFRSRPMFPIRDARGRVIGFGARALDDSQPKYMNSPQTPLYDKSSVLYGLDTALPSIRSSGTAVLVEGYLDVITAHQHGFANVVAASGTAVTERQILQFKKLKTRLVMALDADSAGTEAMLRSVSYEDMLGSEIRVAVLPEGKDPDDVIRADSGLWEELLKEAQPIVDYTFDLVAGQMDISSARGKEQFKARLLPIVSSMKEPETRNHYLEKLAKSIGTTKYEILRVSRRRQAEAYQPRRSPGLPDVKHRKEAVAAEDFCLALLLKYPELKEFADELDMSMFLDTDNRAVFSIVKDGAGLEEAKTDPVLQLKATELENIPVIGNDIHEKMTECLNRMKREYYNVRLEELTQGMAAASSPDEQEFYKHAIMEIDRQLKQIYSHKSRHPKARR